MGKAMLQETNLRAGKRGVTASSQAFLCSKVCHCQINSTSRAHYPAWPITEESAKAVPDYK
eukprot:3402970-Amphidinium_carterae.1